MYLTLSPCVVCAKAIINAGIKEVIYDKEYCDAKESINIMREQGIIVRTHRAE